jgi:hypothetical protein
MTALAQFVALLITSFSGTTTEVTITDSVDLIEVNHHFDEYGRLVMEQVVFYKWCPLTSRYRVSDWRPLKSRQQIPRKDFRRNIYEANWKDGRHFRQVTSPQFRETWTAYDPELADSLITPKQYRQVLAKPTMKTR